MNTYRHLGSFSDLVTARGPQQRTLWAAAVPGPRTQQQVRETLGFAPASDLAHEVRTEHRWEKNGVAGEELSWSVGYGPRTHAYLLRPLGVSGRLPGVVALHDHGGFKFFGKEKIADGPGDTLPLLQQFRDNAYGGRAFANELARQGFVVLVPDTFLWGSRKFPQELLDGGAGESARDEPEAATPEQIAAYNAAAGAHEHTVEKYLSVLGTTLAGVVSYEDRVAAAYLAGRADVQEGGVGCVGLSGGGCRSALLQATCTQVRAAVIVGMMSTYAGLLDHNIVTHTWMFFPAGWARHGDWPDLAACRAPSPLLVQYDQQDPLFTPEGMQAADARIAAHYAGVGAPNNYEGQFYPGPHKFDVPMQTAAFAWLAQQLNTAAAKA